MDQLDSDRECPFTVTISAFRASNQIGGRGPEVDGIGDSWGIESDDARPKIIVESEPDGLPPAGHGSGSPTRARVPESLTQRGIHPGPSGRNRRKFFYGQNAIG